MAYPSNNPKYQGKTAKEWCEKYEALTGFVQAVTQEYGVGISPDPFENLYQLRKALRRGPMLSPGTAYYPVRTQRYEEAFSELIRHTEYDREYGRMVRDASLAIPRDPIPLDRGAVAGRIPGVPDAY